MLISRSISDMESFNGGDRTDKKGISNNLSDSEVPESQEDNAPLFYSPGKRGFHSPRQGRGTYQRLNAFRNVGRQVSPQGTGRPNYVEENSFNLINFIISVPEF